MDVRSVYWCDFCTDLRNIEPAKYVGGGNKEFRDFIEQAKSAKKFIYHYHENNEFVCQVVDKCPKCNHIFTEYDYDSFK